MSTRPIDVELKRLKQLEWLSRRDGSLRQDKLGRVVGGLPMVRGAYGLLLRAVGRAHTIHNRTCLIRVHKTE